MQGRSLPFFFFFFFFIPLRPRTRCLSFFSARLLAGQKKAELSVYNSSRDTGGLSARCATLPLFPPRFSCFFHDFLFFSRGPDGPIGQQVHLREPPFFFSSFLPVCKGEVTPLPSLFSRTTYWWWGFMGAAGSFFLMGETNLRLPPPLPFSSGSRILDPTVEPLQTSDHGRPLPFSPPRSNRTSFCILHPFPVAAPRACGASTTSFRQKEILGLFSSSSPVAEMR